VLLPHDAEVLRWGMGATGDFILAAQIMGAHRWLYRRVSISRLTGNCYSRFQASGAKIVRVRASWAHSAYMFHRRHYYTSKRLDVWRLNVCGLRSLGPCMSDEEIPGRIVTYLSRSLVYDYSTASDCLPLLSVCPAPGAPKQSVSILADSLTHNERLNGHEQR